MEILCANFYIKKNIFGNLPVFLKMLEQLTTSVFFNDEIYLSIKKSPRNIAIENRLIYYYFWSVDLLFCCTRLFLWMSKNKVSTYFSPSFSNWRVLRVGVNTTSAHLYGLFISLSSLVLS